MEMFFLMLVVVGGGLAIYIVPKMFVKRIVERARSKRVKPYLARPHPSASQTPQKKRAPGLDFNTPTFQRKGVQVVFTEVKKADVADVADFQFILDDAAEVKAQSAEVAEFNESLSEVAEVKAQLAALQLQLDELMNSPKKRSSRSKKSHVERVVEQVVDFVSGEIPEQEPLFEVIS